MTVLERSNLTMALPTTDLAPGIRIDDRKFLRPPWSEWIVEIAEIACWLFPHIFGIPKEHAEKMASAALALSAVRGTSVHNAKVVDELNVALTSV